MDDYKKILAVDLNSFSAHRFESLVPIFQKNNLYLKLIHNDNSYLKDEKRVKYKAITDSEVIDAFLLLTQTEGIIPALESAHAIAYAVKIAKKMKRSESIVITLSGRGDKDIGIVQEYLKKNVKNKRKI
mgnify:CR=1 FL=1